MNHGDHNHDSRWNEHQWEAHLNDIEEKSAQLRQFITSDPVGSDPRWLHLINESDTVSEAVDTFIEEEMLLDEAYFPDEDEDELDDLDDELDEDSKACMTLLGLLFLPTSLGFVLAAAPADIADLLAGARFFRSNI